MTEVFVIGAGVAGLSAAVTLAGAGARVRIIEAAGQAGGRCRSYHDPVLDMVIDNGNHFILSGNHATHAYLRAIGAADRLRSLGAGGPDFLDRRDDSRWTLRPNDSPLAWWVMSPKRRVRGTRAADYLALLPLLRSRGDAPIGAVMRCEGVLWERLVGPFLLGALNTEPTRGSSALARRVVLESFARGGAAYRCLIPTPSLAATFVDPALDLLRLRGARLTLGQRVRSLDIADGRVTALATSQGEEPVPPGAMVILAVPPWIAADLMPGLTVPDQFGAIVNAHFKTPPPANAPTMVGVIGGTAEWVFAFEDRLSVTVSGAEAIVDEDREALARRLWSDVAAVHRLDSEPPPWRIVKERRATFAATPSQNARRPGPVTEFPNLLLAGDWTATGLPATIEGAVRSGRLAADLALKATSPP